MKKLNCLKCKTKILPSVANKNGGLCIACKKKEDLANEIPPNRIAFIFSALILFSNAATSLLLSLKYGQFETSIISIIIDTVLGVMLLKNSDNARIIVLLRAILGAILFGIAGYFQEPFVLSAEAIIVQVIFSASLIILLGWKTKTWRLILGGVLGVIYICYLAIAIYLSLKF